MKTEREKFTMQRNLAIQLNVEKLFMWLTTNTNVDKMFDTFKPIVMLLFAMFFDVQSWYHIHIISDWLNSRYDLEF